MKLLIITAVEQFEKDVLHILKSAHIEAFSGSDIDGYKNPASLLLTSSWFPGEQGGVESSLFFSFTEDDKIDELFKLIETFNHESAFNNPIKAVVVPIEKYI
ncbi:hypothetical protein L1I30_05700 [Gillisia sp. M10.2A]|uniref:Uncharacterized protein n=1 Tax=Gillisia lutea TaxID=2909668 RepID=A0ABS9EE41_9FLAO|nr:hypothetical protein [Gillisia lutea]MCF4101151.1 hypothetical protein [Gillisia lutea]